MPRQRTGSGVTLFFALCAVLSLFVYARAFDNPFRQDDFAFLRHVETHRVPDVLTPGSEFAFYRPGLLALFALEHACFGERSGLYIVFNYILHAGIAGLLFLLLRRLTRRDVALFATALFLVGFGHYGKLVMWACTSGSLLSVALSVMSILVLLGGVQQSPGDNAGTRLHTWRPLVSAGLLALAALFHEAAVAVCVVAAFVILAGVDGRSRWKSVIPFLVLLGGFLVLWLSDRRQGGYTAVGLREAVINAPVHLVLYLGFILLPVQSTALLKGGRTDYMLVHVAPVARAVLGLAMLVTLLYVVLRHRGAVQLLAFWVLAAILPFTTLQPPTHHLELRYLYPAAVPFCGLMGMVVVGLWDRERRAPRLVAGTIVLLAIIGTVILQLILESHYDRWTG
ncbi:MAG TPA: hypothetical protein VFH88_14270 [Candidatus Krumholzibacteria bacterium]|nr:hypothetical protein [Candidatus Krumholzibacteria bacterium]